MKGETISHYLPEADPHQADKIIEKLGEGGDVPPIPLKAAAETL